MADRKIFAGARLKRVRARLGISQTQMAAALGLSPSYLNLIERDQRPLTVQVLIKLSSVYGIDGSELAGEENAGLVETLKEIFADPLLAGEVASPTEFSEFVEAAPNAARGAARLFQAYREALERLSDLSHRMAHAGEQPPGAAARLPSGKVAAYFEEASPHFPVLEEAAEEIAQTLSPRDDPTEALRRCLVDSFKVDLRILPSHVMPVERLRYDRHSLKLFVSERVPLIERPFLLARQIALLGHRELLDRLTEEAGMTEPEAARICRSGFAQRLGEAILAPASRLGAAVRDGGLDIMLFSQRFMLRPSRVMTRLAALGASEAGGPSAFVLVLDGSGTELMRIPGAGFPLPRLAPLCARLPLFDGLMPGRPVEAEIELPDGNAFRVTALTEESASAGALPPPRRLALIGWRLSEDSADRAASPRPARRPVGVTCRLCERIDCGHRTAQPVALPGGFLDHVVGPSNYEVIG